MEGCDGTLEGEPDELTIRRYRRFGEGGAKLIWGEATAVVEAGRANPRQIVLNEKTQPAFAKLLQECHEGHRQFNASNDDLLVGLQLTHSGRYSYRRPLIACHDPILDPRTVIDRKTGQTVDANYPLLSDDDLKRLVDHYVAAARMAYDLGFRFVDIKQCHRYLLNELLGARNRLGEFGGSFENRTRLARMIFQAIRAEVPKVLLATRINIFDCIPFKKGASDDGEPCPWETPLANGWGTRIDDPFTPDLSEVSRWLGEMKQLGVVLVNLTMGNPYSNPHVGRPFEYPPPDGYESPEHPLIGVNRHFNLAGELQSHHPDLPLVGTGYSYLQEFLPQAGAANLSRKKISFVGIGRASLAQPDLIRELQQHGKMDRKRICRTFSYCTAMMRSKDHPLGQYPAGCPPFDKEQYGSIWQEILALKPGK
jgi:2,4-dienoyl-CoA reductase-like NADH-dependent reductase (Old Yellow Enzyme family)